MILHVYDAAKKSDSGEVYVASPDQKIIEKVKSYGGNAIPLWTGKTYRCKRSN